MVNTPRVSVVMSTYNEKLKYLELSIKSILNQSYSNIEFIIVLDNPDNKDIRDCINNYRCMDNRIIVIENKKNLGLVKSLNLALEIATGEYIIRMDADDISDIHRIEKQVKFLENNKDVVLVGSDIEFIDENSSYIERSNLLISSSKELEKSLLLGNFIAHPTWAFRRNIIEEIGGYDDVPYAEDYDFLVRVVLTGGKIYNINEKLLKYRLRNDGITQSHEYKQLIITKRIINSYKNSSNSLEKYRLGLDINLNDSLNSKSKDLYYKLKYKENMKIISKFIALLNPYLRRHIISRGIIRTKIYKIL